MAERPATTRRRKGTRRLDLPVTAFTNITCPVERAAAVTRHARRHGTLTPEQAELRRADCVTARAEGRTLEWIAEQVGLSAGRICQLTGPLTTAAGEVSP